MLHQKYFHDVYHGIYHYGKLHDRHDTNYLAHSAFYCATEKTSKWRVYLLYIECMSAFPCFPRQPQAALRVLRCFRPHLHLPSTPCAEAVSPRASFWLRPLQTGLSGIGCVVRSPPLRVQATFGVLSFCSLPCWCLCHLCRRTQCFLGRFH